VKSLTVGSLIPLQRKVKVEGAVVGTTEAVWSRQNSHTVKFTDWNLETGVSPHRRLNNRHNLESSDLRPCVEAFHELEGVLTHDVETCGGYLEAIPPEPRATMVRCLCGELTRGLKSTSKLAEMGLATKLGAISL